ncbi:MAG: lipopolysaccharide assembly protein LapA domain-containing protein [Nitrospirota bacterium]
MKITALLIATVVAVGVSVFSARNPGVVLIDLVIGKFSVTLSLAILGSAVLGACAGGVLVALLKGDGDRRRLREKGR